MEMSGWLDPQPTYSWKNRSSEYRTSTPDSDVWPAIARVSGIQEMPIEKKIYCFRHMCTHTHKN